MKNISEKKLKIGVVHDHLSWCGGGERTALIIALELGADFITAYSSPDVFEEYQNELGEKFISITKTVLDVKVVRYFWLRILFWRMRKRLKNYDILVASGQPATEAVAKYASKKAVKILYNHTPPRRVFDLYESSRRSYKWFLRPMYSLFIIYWKWIYLKSVQKFDINIANSKNIRKRMQKYTSLDVNEIVWPPILTEKFKWISDGNYFISWGRIDEAKRIDIIVRAFQKLPNEKLIVASSGPLFEYIKKLSAGFDNIKVLGFVSDKNLFDLVGNARAAIYIPIDEDAGMTHIEANAAGKPVLGVNEGGLSESIINDKTGILIKSKPNVEDVIKAVEIMTNDWCRLRKNDCIEHSKQYDRKIFSEKIKKIVEENSPLMPILGIDFISTKNEKNKIIKMIEIINKFSRKNIRLRVYNDKTEKKIPLKYQKIIFSKGNKYNFLEKELSNMPIDYLITFNSEIPKHAPKKIYVIKDDILSSEKIISDVINKFEI